MVPQVEESAPPVDKLPIMHLTNTRDYQISLIESRGPNSRGVHMLRAALADIGKTYVPRVVTTTDTTPLVNAQDGHLKMPPPRWTVQRTPLKHYASHVPLLPASIKLPLSSQEALIQEVSIYCMLGWLTLPRCHPLNPVRQWSASPWKPQNTTLNVMDKSSVCTLNILEVRPSCAKCLPVHLYVYQFFSAIINIEKVAKQFHYPMHCLPSIQNTMSTMLPFCTP
jgi:hypothetical protein